MCGLGKYNNTIHCPLPTFHFRESKRFLGGLDFVDDDPQPAGRGRLDAPPDDVPLPRRGGVGLDRALR